jgi:hypothetical protein
MGRRLAQHDRFDVAQGRHVDVVAAQQFGQQHLAAHAGADHADAQALAPRAERARGIGRPPASVAPFGEESGVV